MLNILMHGAPFSSTIAADADDVRLAHRSTVFGSNVTWFWSNVTWFVCGSLPVLPSSGCTLSAVVAPALVVAEAPPPTEPSDDDERR